jgi:hypothetical protein
MSLKHSWDANSISINYAKKISASNGISFICNCIVRITKYATIYLILHYKVAIFDSGPFTDQKIIFRNMFQAEIYMVKFGHFLKIMKNRQWYPLGVFSKITFSYFLTFKKAF